MRTMYCPCFCAERGCAVLTLLLLGRSLLEFVGWDQLWWSVSVFYKIIYKTNAGHILPSSNSNIILIREQWVRDCLAFLYVDLFGLCLLSLCLHWPFPNAPVSLTTKTCTNRLIYHNTVRHNDSFLKWQNFICLFKNSFTKVVQWKPSLMYCKCIVNHFWQYRKLEGYCSFPYFVLLD